MKQERETNTRRISRTSRRVIWVLWSLMLIVPIMDSLLWIYMNELFEPIQNEILPSFVHLPLPPLSRLLGWCVSLLPMGFFLYGCRTLISLFRLYEQGRIFGADNVRCFSKLSRILIAWFIVAFLFEPLESVALTRHHPPGQHILAFGLSSAELSYLLIGIILAVISRVMEEGRIIKEDQELTI